MSDSGTSPIIIVEFNDTSSQRNDPRSPSKEEERSLVRYRRWKRERRTDQKCFQVLFFPKLVLFPFGEESRRERPERNCLDRRYL